MSHYTVTIAIRDCSDAEEAYDRLDNLLEPFSEHLDVPHDVWCDQDEVDKAVAFYRENPQFSGDEGGPVKPFDEYVTEGNLEAFAEWSRQAVGAYCAGGRDDGLYDAEAHRFGYRSTYNPQSQWDWWELGGRWHGYLQLKPGVKVGARRRAFLLPPVGTDQGRVNAENSVPAADETCVAILGPGGVFGDDPTENFEGRADLARKSDIDFDARRTLAAQQAEVTYDKFEEATKGLEIPPTWAETVRTVHFDHDLDPDKPWSEWSEEEQGKREEVMNTARRTFADYPWVKVVREAKLAGIFGDLHEEFCVFEGGRSTYVERAHLDAGVTFAALIDGTWYESGRMGWFGMASDEKDPGAWAREFWRLIESLPDDVYLAVVDCHI